MRTALEHCNDNDRYAGPVDQEHAGGLIAVAGLFAFAFFSGGAGFVLVWYLGGGHS